MGWQTVTTSTYAQYLQPEVVALVGVLLFLWLDARRVKGRTLGIVGVGAALAFLASALFVQPAYPFGFDALSIDRVTSYGRFLVAFIVFLVSWFYYAGLRERDRSGLFYALAWLSVFGGLVLLESSDFVILLIALEILSLPAYALAAFFGTKSEVEGAVKYFLYGAASSALFVFGAALIASVTGGEFGFYAVGQQASALEGIKLGVFALGFVFVLGAFGYKVAFFPWQLWAPDAYQGVDAASLLYLGVVPKVAGFLALYRFVSQAALPEGISSILLVLAALSLIIANFSALLQNSLQRIAAYSSISHAGFATLAFLLEGHALERVLSFYLFAYALSNVAFIAPLLGFASGKRTADGGAAAHSIVGVPIAALNGLSRRSPSAALLLALGVLSLAGVPPLPGFFAKLYLFTSLAAEGKVGVVALGVAMSAVSLGYYLRLVRRAYFADPEHAAEAEYDQPMAHHLAAVFVSLALLAFPFYASFF